jgi:hypothetical protein
MFMAYSLNFVLYQELGVGCYITTLQNIRLELADSLLLALKLEASVKCLTAHSSCLPTSAVEGEADEV